MEMGCMNRTRRRRKGRKGEDGEVLKWMTGSWKQGEKESKKEKDMKKDEQPWENGTVRSVKKQKAADKEEKSE